MKKIVHAIILIAAIVCICSCASEDNDLTNQYTGKFSHHRLSFTVAETEEDTALTRYASRSGAPSITAFTANIYTTEGSVIASNVSFEREPETGIFNSATAVYSPQSTGVKVVAWTPDGTITGNGLTMSLTEDVGSSDNIYIGSASATLEQSKTTIPLTMKHLGTKFTMKCAVNEEDVKDGIKLKIRELTLTAPTQGTITYDLQNITNPTFTPGNNTLFSWSDEIGDGIDMTSTLNSELPFSRICTLFPGTAQANISIVYDVYADATNYGTENKTQVLSTTRETSATQTCLLNLVPFVYVRNGHKFIDLGLPSGTLWAETNVGAETATDYGGSYAWGETSPKETYSSKTYKYYNSTDSVYTKYNRTDGKTTLEAMDDVATVNWGTSCRQATATEWQELIDNCTTVWTSYTSTTGEAVKGMELTGPNGHSIFLPSAGYDGGFAKNMATWYNSSSIEAVESVFQFYGFGSSFGLAPGGHRATGYSVRPVTTK